MKNEHQNRIRQAVRERYAGIAAQRTMGCGCNPPSTINNLNAIPAETVSRALGYSKDDIQSVPEGANLGLGCGNPRAIAGLISGETVLDLGSGAGIPGIPLKIALPALDMTLAESRQKKAGFLF